MLDANFLLSKSELKRLFNVKFRKDHGLFKCYDKIIKNQIKSRITEETPESYIVGEIHYLLHKPVVREDKAKTILLVVLEAHVKSK